MSVWLESLNDQQKEAVQHVQGPLLILAGAGSGKTTVLVSRAGYLIDQGYAQAHQIQVLTFTNKAARELVFRVKSKLSSKSKHLKASTFHSFGLTFLRRYHDVIDYPERFGVIDQYDALGILREISKQVYVDSKNNFDFEMVYHLINQKRVYGQIIDSVSDDYLVFTEWIYPKYIQHLKHLAVVDFEDLIIKPIEILKKFEDIRKEIQKETLYWMIDEFQDTNSAQMELIRLCVDPIHLNLAVVGDDDQSIYGFRGSEVKNILDFPKLFPSTHVVKLEQNYRSTKTILDLSNYIIQKNKNRHHKELKSVKFYLNKNMNKEEVPEFFIFEDENKEAEFVASEIKKLIKSGVLPSEISVLYRANSQSHILEGELKNLGIHYSITGGISLFDRKEIKDIMSYLRLMIGYHELSFRRILHTPPRGIGDVTIEQLTEYARLHQLQLIEVCKKWKDLNISESLGKKIDHFLSFYQSLSSQLLEWQKMHQSGLSYFDIFYNFFERVGVIDYFLSYHKKSTGEDLEEGKNQKRLMPVSIFFEFLQKYILQQSHVISDLFEIIKNFVDFFDLRDQLDFQDKDEHVQLMTLHASKGLEFDFVFLLGIEEDILPHKILGLEIEEERRLFYVGLTRARQGLFLTSCRTRKKYGKPRLVSLSRFVIDVPNHLLKVHSLGVRPLDQQQIQSQLTDLYAHLEKKILNFKTK